MSFHFGIDWGRVALMIEIHCIGLSWSLMGRCPHCVTGLRRAECKQGWLHLVGVFGD
jgi:hypothetical protein